jgi:hypothetical protein
VQIRNLILVGVLAWTAVAAPHVMWGLQRGDLFTPTGFTWLSCLVVFLICFLLATRHDCHGMRRNVLIALESGLALVGVALQPRGFMEVLLVIVAGQLGQLRTSTAIAWVSVQTIALGLLEVRSVDGVLKLFAYFAFQLFGVFTMRVAHEENAAFGGDHRDRGPPRDATAAHFRWR